MTTVNAGRQKVEELIPTRQELLAIFTNPASTLEQKLEAKLFLAKRIANGSNAVRQICEHYRRTPEQSEKLIARHQGRMNVYEGAAAEEARKSEAAISELHGE